MVSNPDALSGAWNFRDIAEEAGIRPGRFFRSSELSGLDDSGQAALVGFGITDVADLRSDREVERRGQSRVPGGVVIHRLPFHELSRPGAEAPHEQSFERMMTEKLDGESAEDAVRQVISMLTDERPVITHCFAGKDRTGFTVATVLEAVGVDRDAIMADFLRSNAAVPQLRDSILDSIRNRSEETTDEILTFAEARLTEEVLGVREVYLDASRRTIDDQYGSLAEYLEAVGVTPAQVERLRGTLLG
jgi:protein-tyrosine phosphatase